MARWLPRKAAAARARLRERYELVFEILAFRHQLTVLRRAGTRRPRFGLFDRLFWVFLSRRWSGWRGGLIVVQPETVLRWRRQGWSLLRRFGRGCRRCGGRPRTAGEIRQLIIRMSRENFLWGAPRIHGELLKLGYDVSQATASRYLPWPRSRSQTWRSLLRNQACGIGLTKPFAARDVADRLILLLRSHLRRAVERPANHAGESLTRIARLPIGRLPKPWLQTSPAPDLGHRREISGLTSAVTARSRFRAGFNPHRPAIARIRGSPLHSRTLRLARCPPRRPCPSSGSPKIAAASLPIERADPAASFLQATGRPIVGALSMRNLERRDRSPIQTRTKF